MTYHACSSSVNISLLTKREMPIFTNSKYMIGPQYLTSGQSNGRITAAYERFSGIRQVEPGCTPPNYTFP